MYTQFDVIKAALKANAPLTIEEIIVNEISEWVASPNRIMMMKAQNYYDGLNDVLYKARTVIGAGGKQVVAQNIADNRISHAFLRELVDQKVQYLLGKPWTVNAKIQENTARIEQVFGKDFDILLRRAGKDAVNKGIAWIYVYPENGELKFYRQKPEELLPLWGDDEHTKLEGMIRMYCKQEYQGKHKKDVNYVEYWDLEGVKRYVYQGGKVVEIEKSAMLADAQGNEFNWERIPFIPVKYNDEEIPLLQVIKPLIDEYDRCRSDDANLLQDQPNGIVVLKNYDGQDLGEFRHNLATYRAVKVTDMGGVESLNTSPNIQASQLHKQGLRRDIYGFGRGMDSQAVIGANASADSRQYLFAHLDLDCNQLEQGIVSALNQLLWFVGSYYGVDTEVDFTFNRDIIISESAAIQMCKTSQDIIGMSAKTVLQNHPWVKSADTELQNFKQQP